jgi:hypothetical protein
MYASKYIEVIGRIEQDGSIQEFTFTNLGDTFDMDAYAQLVSFIPRVPQLFPSGN